MKIVETLPAKFYKLYSDLNKSQISCKYHIINNIEYKRFYQTVVVAYIGELTLTVLIADVILC